MNRRAIFIFIAFVCSCFDAYAREGYVFVVKDVETYSENGDVGIQLEYGFKVDEGKPIILRGILTTDGYFNHTLLVEDPDLIAYLDSTEIVIDQSFDCESASVIRDSHVDYIIRTEDNLLLTIKTRVTLLNLIEGLDRKGVDVSALKNIVFSIRLHEFQISDSLGIPRCIGPSVVSQSIKMKLTEDGWNFIGLAGPKKGVLD